VVAALRRQQRSLFLSFAAPLQGDFVTFLNVYEGHRKSNFSSHWCHKNGLNAQALVSPPCTQRRA